MKIEAYYGKLLTRIATNIKRIRKSKGLTQEDMIDFGFSWRYYQRIESGKLSYNLRTLAKIAHAFKVDIRDLFQ